MKNQIRVTRPELYAGDFCLGCVDLTARDGHYFSYTENVESAIRQAAAHFHPEVIDVQDGNGVFVGRFKLAHRGTSDERLLKLPPEPTGVFAGE